MSTTLPTAVQDQAKELLALNEKQLERFDAIKSATDPDVKSRLKAECAAGLQEIEAKSSVYEDALQLHEQEQESREAIKNLRTPSASVGFPGGGGDGTQTQGGGAPYGMQVPTTGMQLQTLGEMIMQSPQFQAQFPGIKAHAFNVELNDYTLDGYTKSVGAALDAIKTTMTTAAGWAPFQPRLPIVIPSAQRTPSFEDLIPHSDFADGPGQTSGFTYMEETTFTNNAAYTAEGATKPESAFQLTERTVKASKIATTLPVSEEQLEDVPQAQEYITSRGTFQMQLAKEDALLNFTNGSNNWDGFLQKSGVQTQAAGTDPIPTSILKGIIKVMYSPGFAGMPTGLAFNPLDWQTVLTLQETTGAYIWSMPSAPLAMPDMRMWGMMVRPVVDMPQGTALLGNFTTFSRVWDRTGLSVRMAYANDDALKNLIRMIFELVRPWPSTARRHFVR